MNNLTLLIRNQYLLGKSLSDIEELSKMKKMDRQNTIALSLGINGTESLSAGEVMELLSNYYSQNSRRLNYLKKKYKFKQLEQFLSENRVKYYKREDIVMKDVDIVKAYAEYFKSLQVKMLKVGVKSFTFYEYFQSVIRNIDDLKNLMQSQEIIQYAFNIIPKYEGKSPLVRIYGGQLFCNRENLNYGELLSNTLYFLAFPYPFDARIVTILLKHYEKVGTIDVSMSDDLMPLAFVMSETFSTPFRDIFSDFRFTDLSVSQRYDLMIFPYLDDYQVVSKGTTVPLTKEEINNFYKLGKL